MYKVKWIPFLIIILISTGCKNGKNINLPDEPATAVITEKVQKKISEDRILLSGNIEGYKTVRIGFLVAGKINFIAAGEGDLITKDQLVASLDPSSYEIAKELADIQVRQVTDDYERLRIMYENKSISESDFVKISNGLEQAKVTQKLHAKNLADTRIYSPVSGVLLKKLCETGEITGPGIPLFVISDIKKVKVTAFIPENELNDIRIGQEALVNVSAIGDTLKGKITEVGSAADIASRAFSLKIELENPGLLMRPGMIAGIDIPSGSGTEIFSLPIQSVMHDFNNLSYVFVVDTVKNKAFKRYISLGRITGNSIEITSGLAEKEIVVTEGHHKLNDGSGVVISK